MITNTYTHLYQPKNLPTYLPCPLPTPHRGSWCWLTLQTTKVKGLIERLTQSGPAEWSTNNRCSAVQCIGFVYLIHKKSSPSDFTCMGIGFLLGEMEGHWFLQTVLSCPHSSHHQLTCYLSLSFFHSVSLITQHHTTIHSAQHKTLSLTSMDLRI